MEQLVRSVLEEPRGLLHGDCSNKATLGRWHQQEQVIRKVWQGRVDVRRRERQQEKEQRRLGPFQASASLHTRARDSSYPRQENGPEVVSKIDAPSHWLILRAFRSTTSGNPTHSMF
jgi:hypothetical protein